MCSTAPPMPPCAIPPLACEPPALDRDAMSPSTKAAAATATATAATASTPPLRANLAHPPLPPLSALKSGAPGAAAAMCQAASFMWISTAAAFQYRSGIGMADAFRTLYAQGGVKRFYTGLLPTVLHVTLCRFGDTTANGLAIAYVPTDSLAVKTLAASIAGGSWRACLLPLETVRANMQVRGKGGMAVVQSRFAAGGFRALYAGAAASFTAGVLGHFPFFFTVNWISQAVPLTEDASVLHKIGRNGGMGFLAAMCSDVATNGFKIIATNKQTNKMNVSYYDTAKKIVRRDGLPALVTRGLKTRMIGNGLQGAMFVVLWKGIEERISRKRWDPAERL